MSFYQLQPTNLTYDASMDPFTTTEYMYPEEQSWHLEMVEEFRVDNLLQADMELCQRMLRFPQTGNPSIQYVWCSDFFPKIVFEWHYWHDRGVPSDETNALMLSLLEELLDQFHNHIIDPDTGERFTVEWAMLPARAIRERVHPEFGYERWSDEYP